MNNKIFESLDRISDALFNIDFKAKAINEKLDELIAALHEYDDDLSTFEDEPQSGPCSKHDAEQWNEERMDIIGQNGNEGLHYDEPEFDDYGRRVEKDKSNNVQPKQKQYWKNNRSKRAENKK
jgi:hypothetical protein